MISKRRIDEASTLSPVEKMRLLDQGHSRNIKAMSDQKLFDNQRICINNNFTNALYKIETEMLARQLISMRTLINQATTSQTIQNNTQKTSAKEVSGIVEQVKADLKFMQEISPAKFAEFAVNVKNIFLDFDLILRRYAVSMAEATSINAPVIKSAFSENLCSWLIYAIALDKQDIVNKIMTFNSVHNLISTEDLKAVLQQLRQDSNYMSMVDEFTKVLAEELAKD